ncbi:hypothetical protein [Cellulomonas sp. P24]|uniref:hypothetical protein n=1 Tax=Cellulomonas sp. P24 TaxID=2885206 RepID=UPI00216B1007|nr:hypothetical protein [Cellulomonas sp. P24]MCR6492859.1 hypothetical protein [Cellulomonas sp. P24]
MPPRMSARAIFWWGVGAVVTSLVGTQILTRLISSDQVSVSVTWNTWISPILSAILILGATMIGGSIVVRAMRDDDGRP